MSLLLVQLVTPAWIPPPPIFAVRLAGLFQTHNGVEGPFSAPFHEPSFDGHSSAAHSTTANLPMRQNASLHLLGSDIWGSVQGGACVAGPAEAVSSPFAPPSSSSAAAYCTPPYWNHSATPNQDFASQRVGANMANESERSYPQHHQVAAPSSRSATDPKNKSKPVYKRAGSPGQNTPSLLNDGGPRRDGPVLPNRTYSPGSVAEHTFPRSTTVHTSPSFTANRSTIDSGHAPASTSDVASGGSQVSLSPHRDASLFPPISAASDSPIPPSEIEHVPGTTGESSNLSSASLVSHGALASGSVPDADITGTHPSQFALSIDMLMDAIYEALLSPIPVLSAASASTEERFNTEGPGDNQGVLTSGFAQQRTAPPSVASPLPTQEKTVSQAGEPEPGEAAIGLSTAALEVVSRLDEDLEHWRQGVRGQDGYIYQLPPPILWHRPSSRLHDQLWV
ncbi:hypothetical protein ACG7TL_008468 [Trametes sanguinea]